MVSPTDSEAEVRKRKRVPSVLVDCRDCSTTFEVDVRTFDLAVKRGGPMVCDDCSEVR